MILILTGPQDLHADVLEAELTRRGARWVRFDPADVPARAGVSVRFGPQGLRRSIRTADGVLDLEEVTAVWFRRPGRPIAPDGLTADVTRLIEQESATFVTDLWDTLDVPAVPAPRPVLLRAQHKLRQLQLAWQLGFEVPASAIGNDPDAVRELFAACGGSIVSKQFGFADYPAAVDGEPLVRYTEPVRHRDLVHLEGLRHCAMIVQQYVPKRLELRVTVVGERVFAAAIHSQVANHTRHDWRRYDDARTALAPWQLPEDVADRCRRLLDRLGLRFGAIDLVLTPDGRYVFLEINPSGQYLWIERYAGLPITAALADLLLAAPDRTEVPA